MLLDWSSHLHPQCLGTSSFSLLSTAALTTMSSVPFPPFDMTTVTNELAILKANNHFEDIKAIEDEAEALTIAQDEENARQKMNDKSRQRQFTFSDVKTNSTSKEYYSAKNHANSKAHNRTKTFSAVCATIYPWAYSEPILEFERARRLSYSFPQSSRQCTHAYPYLSWIDWTRANICL